MDQSSVIASLSLPVSVTCFLLSAFTSALSVYLQGPMLLWESVVIMILSVIPPFTLYSAAEDIGMVLVVNDVFVFLAFYGLSIKQDY